MLNPGPPMCSHGVIHGLLVGLLGTACSTAPPYAGWTPEQLYEHGQRAYDEGDWREAGADSPDSPRCLRGKARESSA